MSCWYCKIVSDHIFISAIDAKMKFALTLWFKRLTERIMPIRVREPIYIVDELNLFDDESTKNDCRKTPYRKYTGSAIFLSTIKGSYMGCNQQSPFRLIIFYSQRQPIGALYVSIELLWNEITIRF